jgi:hypothetical protein
VREVLLGVAAAAAVGEGRPIGLVGGLEKLLLIDSLAQPHGLSKWHSPTSRRRRIYIVYIYTVHLLYIYVRAEQAAFAHIANLKAPCPSLSLGGGRGSGADLQSC